MGKIPGMRKHPLYEVWRGAIRRCTQTQRKDYNRYGGRGITFFDEWKTDFKAFHDWAYSAGYSPGLELDRRDNDGDYSPGNCRFVTRAVNCANRNKQSDTSSRYIGVSKHPKKWAAVVRHNKVCTRPGDFLTELEAAIARDMFVMKNELPHTLNNVI